MYSLFLALIHFPEVQQRAQRGVFHMLHTFPGVSGYSYARIRAFQWEPPFSFSCPGEFFALVGGASS